MPTFNGQIPIANTNIAWTNENLYGLPDEVGNGGAFSPVQWPLAGAYMFRATDTGLSQTVHWQANFLDSTGTQYGGAGPLSNIVLIRKGK